MADASKYVTHAFQVSDTPSQGWTAFTAASEVVLFAFDIGAKGLDTVPSRG